MESCQQGFAVIDGWRFPIARLEILKGRLHITCAREGPVPAVDGPVTIFGADGLGFLQGGWCIAASTATGQIVELTLDLSIESMSS